MYKEKHTHTYALCNNVFDSIARFLNFVCQFVGVALVVNEVKQKVQKTLGDILLKGLQWSHSRISVMYIPSLELTL